MDFLYTTSRQDPEFLERTSTAREHILKAVMAGIKAQSGKPIHQHWLFVGPRGIGKSHIIALMQHRVSSDPSLLKKWLPVLMPEEATGIISLRDFLEKIVQLCIRRLTKDKLTEEAREFEAFLATVAQEPDDRKAVNRARAFLTDWKNSRKRKILVLIENADRVIGKRIAQKPAEEKWLRDLLMNEDLLLLIASSPTFFKQIANKDHPLYELFKIEVLEDLNFDESLKLLTRYAEQKQRADLVEEFIKRKNHLKALHTLTGGNPRLLIMIYLLIQKSAACIDDVEHGFYRLLEDLTPYFQSRLAQLSGKEEKILTAFAESPELLTPAEVGRKIRMPTNLVTANLARLQTAGFINRIEKPIKGRKGTLYRLSETIYRYWHQMSSESDRKLADIFVRFIVLYYTHAEIDEIYGAYQNVSADGQKRSIAMENAPRKARHLETARDMDRQQETIRRSNSINKALEKNLPFDKIDKMFQDLLALDPDDFTFLNRYGGFLCVHNKFDQGINQFKKVLEIATRVKDVERQGIAYSNWGIALLALAGLKSDKAFYHTALNKFDAAWSIIKKMDHLDHPLMVRTALEAAGLALFLGREETADQRFLELLASLPKIKDLNASLRFFFEFFTRLAKHGRIDAADRYLKQLLKTKYKKELNPLNPLKTLFRYLLTKDKSLIRRQPPEIQKVLKELIADIEKKK